MVSPKRGPFRSPHWVEKAKRIRAARALRFFPAHQEESLRHEYPDFSRFFRNDCGDVFGLRARNTADPFTKVLFLYSIHTPSTSVAAQVKVSYVNDEMQLHDLEKADVVGKQPTRLYFSNVELRPRGLGFMGAFLAVIIPEARAHHMKRISLFVHNKKVEEYYEKFGFRKTDRYEKDMYPDEAVKMVLLLEDSRGK